MTRTFFSLKKTALVLSAALAAAFCVEVQAQFTDMMKNRARKSRSEKSNIPTRVNSDAMDIDIGKDTITLLGNVEVDDPEMNIKCRKMMIFLEKKQDTGKAAAQPASGDGGAMDPAGGKQVSHIECIGDVVITRTSADEVAGSKVQKAFAGKAVYDVRKDMITLTENRPVVVNGAQRLSGEKIEIDVKNERIIITGGAIGQADGGLFKK